MSADLRGRLIVQAVPPGEGGVRDYMACLASQWTDGGAVCVALPLAPAEVGRQPLAQQLTRLTALHGSTGRTVLVLYFSGYGYHRRGLCGWLVDEVARARRALGDRLVLAVVFHELFARGEPPWRSAFWLSPLQAASAKRLARLADVVWTNTSDHAAWLRSVLPAARRVQAWPVFSNVGEPAELPAPASRPPQAVLFGSFSTRRRTLAAVRRCGEPLLARLGVETLLEVGAGGSVFASGAAPPWPARSLGNLPLAEVSAVLADSRFGLIEYPAQLLGKSGVFAAYAAHGCLVFNAREGCATADALVPGDHYAAPGHPAPATGAPRLHAWYAQHALARQADALRAMLVGAP